MNVLPHLDPRWGGKLIRTTPKDFDVVCDMDTFWHAPFTSHDLGIRWPEKEIYYTGNASSIDVIHEMGHVFACLQDPGDCNELIFIGWEIALARLLLGDVAAWFAGNRCYGIAGAFSHFEGDPAEIGDIRREDRPLFVEECIQSAASYGLLSPRGTPIAIR